MGFVTRRPKWITIKSQITWNWTLYDLRLRQAFSFEENTASYETVDEIKKWMETNCKGRWTIQYYLSKRPGPPARRAAIRSELRFNIEFSRPEEAMFLKLSWWRPEKLNDGILR